MQHHDRSLGQTERSLRLPATMAVVLLGQQNFLADVCNGHSYQVLPELLNPNQEEQRPAPPPRLHALSGPGQMVS